MFESWKISRRCRWYNFKSSIRLYHGTSDVFVPQISRFGLTVPMGDIEERVWEAVLKCGVDYDRHLRRKLREEARYLWSWNHVECICLSTNPYNAASYAEHNHKNGGELNNLVRCHLGKVCRKKFSDLYPESNPVVVEALIPTSWLSEKVIKLLQEASRHFGEDDHIHNEIRLYRRVPKSKITRIMPVPK